ncbi:MAG: S9 family peptidase [Bacteroidetes bacterium]|nr:MAG: S9 family peptidase [Bacteroidota bacterium]
MKPLVLLVITMLISGGLWSQKKVLTPELLWKLKRMSGGTVSPDGQKVLYQLRSYSLEENKGNTDLFVYDLGTGKITQLTDTPFSEMEAQWGPDRNIWFLSSESGSLQLWRMDSEGQHKKQLSQRKESDIEGFRVSPNGKEVILLRPVKVKKDIVEKYPDLPLAEARIEDDLMYRHWNAWSDGSKRHLFLHRLANDLLEDEGKDLMEGEPFDGIIPPFGGLENISFSPDGAKIAYASKKKIGKEFAISTNSQIYEYEIRTGKTTLLTKSYKGYDTAPSYSSDAFFLSWLSMAKDGFESDKNDIILRDLRSGKDKNLTAKHDLTVESYRFSNDGKTVYFIAPYQGSKQLFELEVSSGDLKQLTEGQQNYLSVDLAGGQLIALRQSMTAPTDMYSVMRSNGKARRLTEVNKEVLEGIEWPKIESRWINTTDDKKMLVWLILPPDFDQSKKYPTLLYCQGGPQSMVSQFFSYRWNFSLMASQGYAVIAPNRRGLPGFGQEWNDEISGDWGGQAMRDYLAATDELSKESFIDESKMGAIGASYGGYSVYYLAGIHENRFKTFISHCGLFNLESWYGTTEELFFANWDNKGPYWLPKNREYYEKNSPHKYVNNWNTPMLVIHGGHDFRVPESEGMQAFQALQVKGIRSKYLYFPKEGHWVLKPQNGVLWHREFFEWLDTDLK